MRMTRTEKWKELREKISKEAKEEKQRLMSDGLLTIEMAQKIKELRDYYYSLNPDGDYLEICFDKYHINFYNEYWKKTTKLKVKFNEENLYEE